MNSPKLEQARQYAEKRLASELSPDLIYHGIAHTREEVVPAVETLAAMEGMKGKPLTLLRTAAWFHDLGYVENATYHELISARIAGEVLPSFGYRKDEVETVWWAILATALPQYPRSHLEKILVDADLDVLGQQNFMQRNRDLREELARLGRMFTDEQWYAGQLQFLEGHEYFTDSAHLLRDAQKARNIAHLKSALEALSSSTD
jgi:uncharacterized protein